MEDHWDPFWSQFVMQLSVQSSCIVSITFLINQTRNQFKNPITELNQVLHFYFRTHVCFAWLFQFLFFRILVVIKKSVGSFSMSMKSSLLHILSSKKVVETTGIFTWNVNMQFVCHKRGSLMPMLHCTGLCTTVQWHNGTQFFLKLYLNFYMLAQRLKLIWSTYLVFFKDSYQKRK